MYMVDELSYDDFHENKEKTYRLSTKGRNITAGLTGFRVGPTLKQEIEEVDQYCRLLNFGRKVDVVSENFHDNENGIFYADPSFFDVFTFPLIKSAQQQPLVNEREIVLSESMAQKYFPDEEVVGKTIEIDKQPFVITGVITDAPGNSDIQYGALVSMPSLNPQWAQVFSQDWFRIVCFTYLSFTEKPDMPSLQAQLDAFGEKYIRPWAEQNGSTEMYYYEATPIAEVHFDNSNEFDSPKGNMSYLYIFGLIALFILIIACINFINLSLAQASRRAKEIGVRKSLGSSKWAIRGQFFLETSLTALGAFFLALVFVELALPMFNGLAGKSFEIGMILKPGSLLLSLGIVAVVSLLSASYPALILASFEPVQVLKGNVPRIGSVGFVRKVLVVMQFAFAISMMLGTLVVYGQMDYMKNKDLGFKTDQVYVFRVPSDSLLQSKLEMVREDFMKLHTVESATLSSNVPGQGFGELMVRVEKDTSLEEATMRYMSIDDRYLQTMDLYLVRGRNFNAEDSEEIQREFIINEKTAEVYGWGNDAIGKRIQIGLLADNQATIDGKVIGVVKDFNYESLHNPIEPLAIQFISNFKSFLSVRISGNLLKTQKKLHNIWSKYDPGRIQEAFFLDEEFAMQYAAEQNLLKIFGFFAGLSLLISVLGLYALSSFMIRLKTKEIGVRKVLGASYGDILRIISKEFLNLIGIAFLLAIPISFYFLNQWLSSFAYSIDFQWWFVLITAFIALILTGAVVVYHARRVSFTSPIYELRYD